MSDKVGNRKMSGLMAYLDSLVEKGRAKSSSVVPLKTAVRRIFETVDGEDWESTDISTVDIDDYIGRFKNLALDRYNTDSYNTYRGRAVRALSWYNNFLQDPGWVPNLSKTTSIASSKTKKVSNDIANPPKQESQGHQETLEVQPQKNELISFPFPMSDGKLASLYLPKNISREDSERLSKFISTLVIESNPDGKS